MALALFVLGVSDEQIMADYAETDQHLQDFYAESQARHTDPQKRADLARFQVSDPADMGAALAFLRELGGLEYLTRRGFAPALQSALVARLTRL